MNCFGFRKGGYILIVGIGLGAMVWAQEKRELPEEKPEVIVAEETIEILDPIDKVTFPPPPPPKPQPLPEIKQLSNIERGLAKGQKLKTHWIEPIDASYDPPVVKKSETPPMTEEELAALEEEYGRHTFLSISATVFDEKTTFLRWTYEGKPYYGWSGVHFGHLAGIGQFKIGKQHYSLFMGWGRRTSEGLREDTWPGPPPEIPQLPPQFEPLGEVPEEALEPIIVLHKVYAKESERLETLYEKRQEASAAWREWHAANPPEPKDLELYFWPSKTARIMTKPLPRDMAKVEARRAKAQERIQEVLAKREAKKQVLRQDLPQLMAPTADTPKR